MPPELQVPAPLLPIDDPTALEMAARALGRGELIAYPTDTLYGVGGDARSAAATARVLAAKGRDVAKGLPVLVSQPESARALARRWPDAAEALAQRFWPGGLTLIVPAIADLPAAVRPGGAVAVRVPARDDLRLLIDASGCPLIGTSANRSGEPPAVTAMEAAQALGRSVVLVLDGGRVTGEPSTVVELVRRRHARVLRHGAVPGTQLREALDRLGWTLGEESAAGSPRR